MSLTASLQIGRSALTASQLAIQVAGDNLANASTPGFSRRVATLTPTPGAGGVAGIGAGRGVSLVDVSRRVDQALLSRLRASVSDQQAAIASRDLLLQIESLTNDLSEFGLSGQLSEFYNAFSELANNPLSPETKSLLVEQGVSLASHIRSLRSDLLGVRSQVDQQLTGAVRRADELLEEIASLNVSISTSELGSAENAALRDQRDQKLQELSELVDVSVVQQPSGAVDISIGSTPIVNASGSRGLNFKIESEDGELVGKVVVPNQLEERVNPKSGRIGALLEQRAGLVNKTIEDLDSVASSLIFEVNRIHSSGRPFPGLTSTVSERKASLPNQTLALNDPDNTAFAPLPFAPTNGSFTVLVTNRSTGQTEERTIQIDLDGVDNTGAPGFGDDTSLADIQSALDGVPNLNATIGADGRISITSDAGFEFGFADDTSGVLATLGINTYFSGVDARDINIRQQLLDNPSLLVSGREEGGNDAALAIVGLQERALESLDGSSISEAWRRSTNRTSVAAASASTRADAETQVRASLDAQRAGVSGVSIDEESINLLGFQRQFQASAQFISIVDELTQTLIGLV